MYRSVRGRGRLGLMRIRRGLEVGGLGRADCACKKVLEEVGHLEGACRSVGNRGDGWHWGGGMWASPACKMSYYREGKNILA